jgi:cobalt-zinc-cadmium efflux system protein
MAHHHDHGPQTYNTAFAVGVALNAGFVALEVGFGLAAHSIALIADAGHNLSDVLGLVLAWGAGMLAQRRPSKRRIYGLRRTSIFAALINAIVLLMVTGGVAWEAIRRLGDPGSVSGKTVMAVAAAGVAVNGATAWLFFSGRQGDLNIRGAFLHMAADAGLALGVVLAGAVILATGWRWLDPAASLVISGVILLGTWGLLRDSVNLALDAVPDGVDEHAVEAYLAGLPAVTEVHDLHVWGMSTTENALTAHLVIPDGSGGDALLAKACRELHDRFGIEHATIQLERGDPAHPCRLASAETV